MITPRNSWRYKMIVEVETPEGVRTGSAVREVTFRPAGHAFIAEGRESWRVRGQAVVVELPGGKKLYALLTGGDRDESYGARIADRAIGERGRLGNGAHTAELYPKAPDRQVFRVTDPMPMLVTFGDHKDFKSIQRLVPAHLERVLGPGIRLQRITLEVTAEPITDDIDRALPDFGPGSGFSEWYRSLQWSDPRRVSPEAFKQGI
jgi:hypothetical protein